MVLYVVYLHRTCIHRYVIIVLPFIASRNCDMSPQRDRSRTTTTTTTTVSSTRVHLLPITRIFFVVASAPSPFSSSLFLHVFGGSPYFMYVHTVPCYLGH